jgi:hypothetical protein
VAEPAAPAADLSGNLKEWVNDPRVVAGQTVYTLRGGSFDNYQPGLTCDFDLTVVPSTYTFANAGFRCCALACPAGQIECGGVCINPATSASNCGACGNVCGGGRRAPTATAVRPGPAPAAMSACRPRPPARSEGPNGSRRRVVERVEVVDRFGHSPSRCVARCASGCGVTHGAGARAPVACRLSDGLGMARHLLTRTGVSQGTSERNRAVRILAKSLYRDLRSQGFDERQIVSLATELISEVTQKMSSDAARVEVSP